MTTEVTIDDVTAALIKKGADAAHISFQEAAAAALRAGAQTTFGKPREPYKETPQDFGDPMINLKETIARIQEEDDLERIRRISG